MPLKKRTLLKLFNLWPPFLASGIHIGKITPDFRQVEVELRLRPWNQNYVGTHYGGSLYSMADPFYMIMVLENLGSRYIVWDKAASIRFKKPGRGVVRARFELTEERINEIRRAAESGAPTEPKFLVTITDEAGEIVAEVEKTLYVRRKSA